MKASPHSSNAKFPPDFTEMTLLRLKLYSATLPWPMQLTLPAITTPIQRSTQSLLEATQTTPFLKSLMRRDSNSLRTLRLSLARNNSRASSKTTSIPTLCKASPALVCNTPLLNSLRETLQTPTRSMPCSQRLTGLNGSTMRRLTLLIP